MTGKHVHRYELWSFDGESEGKGFDPLAVSFLCRGKGRCKVRMFSLGLGDQIPEWVVDGHPSPKKGGRT